LPEAQQVLGMLKEEEYFDFVRRDSRDAGLTSRTELTPEEAALEKRYNEIADRVTLIGKERGELLAKAARTADEDKRLTSLDADIAVAGQAFEKFLTSLADELGGADQPGGKVFQLRESQGLMQDLRELGNGAVALYTIVGEDKYRIILTTPDAQKAVEYPISAADLNRKILAFRETLQNPRLDPLPLARELYKIIVGPVAKDLKDAGAETLMWSLDGALRYVPITALHDGEKYMVERYRNVVFTPASQARLKDAPSANWKVLGLGVSKAKEGFDALPGAALELRGIIREDDATKAGVLPGTIKLDEAFTADALKTGLRQRFPLVHIASHFQFRPGNDADSFLLLGDGSHLTLGQIKSLPNIFGGVELLTLSACNTATGGAGASGKEVEGFGVLAQRQGAKAVMATLWSVADESTSLLMQEFYRLREARPGTLKAEAIRQAQLALLYGKKKAVSTGTQRRAERENNEPGPSNQPLFKQNPEAPYAHPYYWAPFILIGNWK
jgi:CHAT domain-containing protein